jgi:hypothetical protein
LFFQGGFFEKPPPSPLKNFYLRKFLGVQNPFSKRVLAAGGTEKYIGCLISVHFYDGLSFAVYVGAKHSGGIKGHGNISVFIDGNNSTGATHIF